MRKYIPLVLFIFLWPVLSADIHGRVVRVLDGDTIEVMDSRKAVRIRLVNHRNIVADAFAMLSCPPRKREKVSFPPLPAFL